jgi:hypothetical protein
LRQDLIMLPILALNSASWVLALTGMHHHTHLILFYGWVIFHYVYVYCVCPSICW